MAEGFEQLTDNYLSTLDTEYIDCFRKLFSQTMDLEFKKINSDYESACMSNSEHSQQYKEWIQDEAVFKSDVSELADELSIIALYKLFEQKHKELLMTYSYDAYHEDDELYRQNLFKLSNWRNVLPLIPKEIKNNLVAVNELRLLNNAIKHEGSISSELSRDFPIYGNEGEELSGLAQSYLRLKPIVVNYIIELHQVLKANKIDI